MEAVTEQASQLENDANLPINAACLFVHLQLFTEHGWNMDGCMDKITVEPLEILALKNVCAKVIHHFVCV